MAKKTYKKVSPWGITPQTSFYLDLYIHRSIPADETDRFYVIPVKFHERPDLAAYDIYKKTDFWWIFAVRNPDLIMDPIYDFKSDLQIRVPTFERLNELIS